MFGFVSKLARIPPPPQQPHYTHVYYYPLIPMHLPVSGSCYSALPWINEGKPFRRASLR